MTATQASNKTGVLRDDDTRRIAPILAALTAELEAQTEHVSILTAQTEALKACDRIGYARLHERHEELLTDAELRSLRFKKMAGQGEAETSLSTEIEGWPEPEREQALVLTRQLRRIAAQVHDLSERNGALIQGELRLIAFQMNFILAAAHQDTSYASTGVGRTVQANRLLNSVA